MSQNAERVGVVGDAAHTATVVQAIEEAGSESVVADPAALAAGEPAVDSVVAVGEAALLDLVDAGSTAPVLPVEAGRGVRSLPRESIAAGVADLVAGRWERVDHPILVADHAGGAARALFDLMLVTDEPARISEYAVASGDTHVSTFRADAVVVASPAGSTGYARDAGGAVVAPGTGVGAVVPVAPFATSTDDWVLPIEGLELTVEREETPVVLLADDREVGEIPAHDPVTVGTDGTVSLAAVDASRPFYGGE